MKTTDTFRLIARQAKQRMKQGYWEDANNSQKICLHSSSLLKNSIERNLYSDYHIGLPLSNEEEMYNKVCEIFRTDSAESALGQLIDKKYYNSISAHEQERYVLYMAKIYRKLKCRYLLENKNY